MIPHIRRIRSSEGLLLRSLQLQAYREAPYAFGPIEHRLRAMTDSEYASLAAHRASADDSATFFAAHPSCAPIGTASIITEAGQALLSFVWIASGARKGGLGERLIDHALDWATQQGHTTISGMVVNENPQALSFYLRRGWRVADIQPWPSNRARYRFVISRPLGETVALQ